MGECALILSVRGAEVKVPADINAPPVGLAEVDLDTGSSYTHVCEIWREVAVENP